MRRCHIDFETRSRVDLKKVGAWAYAAHPSTEIMCMAWAIHDPILRSIPEISVVRAHHVGGVLAPFQDPGLTIVAHNAHFEYAIYHEILVRRFGWPPIEDPMRWDCTLARAAMCNLPISLDACGAALKITAKKDLIGRQAMLKLCKPGPDGNFIEDPALYETLYEYCKGDVRAEMEIDRRLPPMPPAEKDIWNLDLIINKRGIRMDVPLAKKAASMVGELTSILNQDLHRLTGGAVDKASRVQEIKRYLAANGLNVESLDKQAVTAILNNPKISQHLKDVVNIRRQVGKTSTSKYQAILDVASPTDQRARGLLQYHGASTGRWAGRLIQPHNFPKGVTHEEQNRIINSIMSGDVELFTVVFGAGSMDALSGALRGTMIADGDSEIIVADYSTIEPRVLFWLAGETSALEAYRMGADLYVELARTVFRNPNIVNDKKYAHERAVGKFGVLGCGYGMGAPRFQAQCAAAQPPVDITLELAGTVVRAYRDKYTRVTRLWREVEAAAKKAVRDPGPIVPCCGGRVHWGMDKKREFLVCRLPNGKLLRYFRPSLVATEWGDELHYWGPGLGGALEEQKTYGGSLVENIVQAVARELLAAAMLRLEMAGYDTLFHVHDEIVSRGENIPSDDVRRKGILDHYLKTMCETPVWATGCPIKAEGWIGRRYRK